MRRDISALRRVSMGWLQAPEHSDGGVVERLDADSGFSVDDVVAMALTRLFHRATATLDAGLLTGDAGLIAEARGLLERGRQGAAEARHVPLWWSFTVARHLFGDLWGHSLHVVLPSPDEPPQWRRWRRRFIQLVMNRDIAEIDLWPSQLEAASRVMDVTDDLVVALPTSAGKTRIAELCILRTLAEGRRVIYVTPLRALSAQVERNLSRTFGPLGASVTSVYGASGMAVVDLHTIKSASIVVATPEKLDFAARLDPSVIDNVGLIVLDEGHMIGLGEREIRYEMLVQRLLRRGDAGTRRLVCLSAVFTEGDAFDDFTRWLRSDVEGHAVRSTWRPTRQRPGIVEWRGTAGRLELQVEGERPFVPRFVEAAPAKAPRRRSFPADDQELNVATVSAFLGRGHSVLVYCPLKKSVEATAQAFLKACRQGYFGSVLSASAGERIKRALRLGHEWLGEEHPAVACLHLGIGVHHGALPRQFLHELEILLKDRVLPVCISSPTLAQGVDLCFSVLVFRSVFRNRKTIPPKEFANIVGRVGRAFVDLDGLYVLPIMGDNSTETRQRAAQFQQLITSAQERKLESGVRLLIELITRILQERLNVSGSQLREYVLNEASTWTVPPADDDDVFPGLLQAALNELDTAILGIVDTLELPTDQLAEYLDTCLRSSYWQRRLGRQDAALKDLQESVVRGRAYWIWERTDAVHRRRYFAAGVGYAAGHAIDMNRDRFAEQLAAAESALQEGHVEDAIASVIAIARTIFTIHPFRRENTDVANWEALLGNWIRGTPLSQCADSYGVSFIQEDVVFRLVWGVEAVRLHLQGDDNVADVPGGALALCLTYGVPNVRAALFMQAGIKSRVFAQRVAEVAGLAVFDLDHVRIWVFSVLQGSAPRPVWDNGLERTEWAEFLERFGQWDQSNWSEFVVNLAVEWIAPPASPGTRVRVIRDDAGPGASVYAVTFELLGRTTFPNSIETSHVFAVVSEDTSFVSVEYFGVVRIPDYLSD